MKRTQPSRGAIIVYMILLLLLLFALYKMFSASNSLDLKYSDVIELFNDGKVESFAVDGSKLTMKLREEFHGETLISYKLPDFNLFYEDLGDTISEQLQAGTIKEYDVLPVSEGSALLSSLLPMLIIGTIFIFVMMFLMNRMGGGASAMKFSRANAKVGQSNKKVTFADVAGAEEEKAELQEIVEFLRDPTRYNRLGAKVPKGVLLVGPPGTGRARRTSSSSRSPAPTSSSSTSASARAVCATCSIRPKRWRPPSSSSTRSTRSDVTEAQVSAADTTNANRP